MIYDVKGIYRVHNTVHRPFSLRSNVSVGGPLKPNMGNIPCVSTRNTAKVASYPGHNGKMLLLSMDLSDDFVRNYSKLL